MKKLCLLLCTVFLFFQFVEAQNQPSESLRAAFQDGEYFFAREDFVDALKEYNTVYKRGFSDNANLNYRIGVCYLNIPGEKENAIPYLEKAIHNVSVNHKEGVLRETTAPIDAFIYLGDAYRVNNKLDKAILSYTEYLELYQQENDINSKYARKQIQASNLAKEYMNKPVVLDKINLGPVVNSSSANYAGVISGDGSTLVYMNDLPFYTAVYMCTLQEDSTWSEPKNITPEILSDGDQFVASLSYNADELYLVQEGLFDSDIRVSEREEDGSWGPSVPLNKNINTKYWESHACVSKDGQTLYFTSNRKESYGEMDIFISKWNPNGYWEEAVNAGRGVNSEFNEDFPFITADDERLYFSSQGHESMGGFDIFYATKNDSGVFSNPINVGYPVNTTDDDNFFFPLNGGNYGLKALITENGYGQEDLYKLRIVSIDEASTMLAQNVETDAQEEVEVQESEVEEEVAAEEPVLEEAVTEELAVEEPIQQAVVEPEPEIEEVAEEIVEEVAVKEVSALEFEISNITFGFDSYELSQADKEKLNKYKDLLRILTNESSVKLLGYTDSVGNNDYNLRLSDKRANSVKQYLLKLGFTENQLYIAGMGENNPVASNETPEGRAANRRVEIQISGYDQTLLQIIKK